jgi:hypothetical protein
MASKGRPLENDTPKLIYTQEFKDHNGERFVWTWNKIKNPNGPISVEMYDPQFNKTDRLLLELKKIEDKYIPIKGERKPRITKEDKKNMEDIISEVDEFYYSFWPEDRPKIRGRKPKNK